MFLFWLFNFFIVSYFNIRIVLTLVKLPCQTKQVAESLQHQETECDLLFNEMRCCLTNRQGAEGVDKATNMIPLWAWSMRNIKDVKTALLLWG